MKKETPLLLTFVVIAGWAMGSQAHADSFQGLGSLLGGSGTSHADGISTDGSTVVGRTHSTSGSEAFRWTPGGGMEGLGYLAGGISESRASGVSANGSTVVGYSMMAFFPDFETEAFRWTQGGGAGGADVMEGLGLLSVPWTDSAYAVSSDGSTVVGQASGQAFQWTDTGGMVGLGFLPTHNSSSAEDISDDGSAVVGHSWAPSVSNPEAFLLVSGGAMVGLGDLPGGMVYSRAYAVSSNGSTVVGQSAVAGGFEAFSWTSGGGMMGLGELQGGLVSSTARGVSTDGSVVVGKSDSSSGEEAFVWTVDVGMISLKDYLEDELGLDLTGWTLTSAEDISGDGRTIVGHGRSASAAYEGWIATIPQEIVVPEPSAILLQAGALVTLVLLRRGRA